MSSLFIIVAVVVLVLVLTSLRTVSQGTMAVTTIPATNASMRLDTFCPMTWRRFVP